jgi:hypothetical protein
MATVVKPLNRTMERESVSEDDAREKMTTFINGVIQKIEQTPLKNEAPRPISVRTSARPRRAS